MPYVPEAIVGYIGGTYTPGAESALALNVDIINACWNKALERMYDYDVKVGDLTTDVTGWLATHKPPQISETAISPTSVVHSAIVPTDVTTTAVTSTAITPTAIAAGSISVTPAVEPSMTLADLSTATVFNDFGTLYTDIVDDLVAKFLGFLVTHFPNESATYAAAEAYMLAKINNVTNSAIPAAIKSAIIDSGRVEIIASATRAIADATIRFAAMRHPLPPGALAGATARIAQTALDAEGDLIKTVAIKDFELTEMQIRDAVGKALANRQAALGAATAYISALVQGINEGNQITNTAHRERTSMLDAVRGYFQARITASEVALKATTADVTTELDADKSSAANKLEADRANQAAEIEAAKITSAAELEADKITAANALEASRQNAANELQAAIFSANNMLEAAKLSAANKLDVDKANQAADLADVENYIRAFDGELKALMAAAVGLLNNVRAGGSVDYRVDGT